MRRKGVATKSVYFFGAGAANPCGYLTTKQLYRELTKELGGSLLLLKNHRPVLDQAIGQRPVDIETLYTLVNQSGSHQIEAWYRVAEAGPLAQRFLLNLLRVEQSGRAVLSTIDRAFEEAGPAILNFIQEKFWYISHDLRPYEDLKLVQAASGLGSENVSVFTTNYDLSLEEFFDSRGLAYHRGVVKDKYVPRSLVSPSSSKAIKLVKLHGSLDFYKLRSGEIAVINAKVKPGMWKHGQEVVDQYLVPPIEGKIDYDPGQRELFALLEAEVAAADMLAIIGCSFRDKNVAEALSRARPECSVLIACGSRSPAMAEELFPTMDARIRAETSYFPHPSIRDWIAKQLGL